ncbi:MAG: hypothetical protein QNJ85_10255 [Gammaproteobacteria bacterium]|nr:hypothetical protein [Gammaproteobacteria bacterium]
MHDPAANPSNETWRRMAQVVPQVPAGLLAACSGGARGDDCGRVEPSPSASSAIVDEV